MTTDERAPHDLGGLAGAAIDRAPHDPTQWERRVDAMEKLLFIKGVLQDAAELRRGIEALGPDAYASLTYYERWVASLALLVTEKGIVDGDELERRVADVRARGKTMT